MEGTGLSWKQLGQDIDGEAAGDMSGISVALSADGKTLAIGANGNDGNGSAACHMRVYHMDRDVTGLSWKMVKQLEMIQGGPCLFMQISRQWLLGQAQMMGMVIVRGK